jgi:hypothetical membrane protein
MTHLRALSLFSNDGLAMSMEFTTHRVGALCGIAGPMAFLVLYIVAMAGDPEYTFFENYLSDLGVGDAAWAFNSGVIIAGVLAFPFALLGIRPALNEGIPTTGAIVAILVGAAFLILVGIFTEDYSPTHYYVTIGFFMSMLVALGFFSWSLHSSEPLGKGAEVITDASFALGLVLAIFGFNPITETIAVPNIVVWATAIASILLLREDPTLTS